MVESINKNGVALKGVFSIPEFSPTNTGDLQNLNQKFRNSLDIYANVIQVKSLPGVQSKHKNVDFIVVREQTEGEYSALEHEPVTGKFMALNKDGLISESLSFWLKSPKQTQNHSPEHYPYPPKEKMLRGEGFGTLFWSQSEKLCSEV